MDNNPNSGKWVRVLQHISDYDEYGQPFDSGRRREIIITARSWADISSQPDKDRSQVWRRAEALGYSDSGPVGIDHTPPGVIAAINLNRLKLALPAYVPPGGTLPELPQLPFTTAPDSGEVAALAARVDTLTAQLTEALALLNAPKKRGRKPKSATTPTEN